MYLVKIASGSIKEIDRVMQILELDLRAGIKVDSKQQAYSIACAAYDVEPWIEVDVLEVEA